MDDEKRLTITRVRLLALRAQGLAGGPPLLWQLLRALEHAPADVASPAAAGPRGRAAVVKEDVFPAQLRRERTEGEIP